MSRTAKTVIVVAVALLATGICGGAWLLKARDLPGEVFLLAKDGTATRLALVEVSVYPRAQVEPYLAVLTNGLAEFALPVKEASSRWHEANEAYGKAVDAWELNLKKGDLDLTEKLKSDRFRRSSDEEFKKLMSLLEAEDIQKKRITARRPHRPPSRLRNARERPLGGPRGRQAVESQERSETARKAIAKKFRISERQRGNRNSALSLRHSTTFCNTLAPALRSRTPTASSTSGCLCLATMWSWPGGAGQATTGSTAGTSGCSPSTSGRARSFFPAGTGCAAIPMGRSSPCPDLALQPLARIQGDIALADLPRPPTGLSWPPRLRGRSTASPGGRSGLSPWTGRLAGSSCRTGTSCTWTTGALSPTTPEPATSCVGGSRRPRNSFEVADPYEEAPMPLTLHTRAMAVASRM